jgi:hypothetical protein
MKKQRGNMQPRDSLGSAAGQAQTTEVVAELRCGRTERVLVRLGSDKAKQFE